MKKLLLASLLALLPLSAQATTYAVTNDSTLTVAMAAVKGGDRVNIASGTYTAALFLPDTSGRAYTNGRIRIVGQTAHPESIVVDGAVALTKSYLALYGLNFKGRLTVGSPDSITGASHDSVAYCKVDSGGVWVLGDNNAADTTTTCSNNVITNVTVNCGDAGASWAWKLRDASDCTFDKVKFTARLYTHADAGRGRYIYYSRRNAFVDCRFNLDYCDTTSGEQNALMIRDLSAYNTFTRDTVWIGMNSKGLSQTAIFSGSGNVGHSGSCIGNSWYYCDYRSYDSYFYAQDGLHGGGMYFSVFASLKSSALEFQEVADFTFRGNTVYAGGSKALRFYLNPTTTIVRGNVFVTRAYPVDKEDELQPWQRSACLFANMPGAFGSDSNYFAPAVARHMGGYNGGYNSMTKCLTLADWQANTGNDMASRSGLFSGHLFMDARWATLDLRPSAHSALYNAAAPGGHYGALAKP